MGRDRVIHAFVIRRMDTVNAPQNVGQWDWFEVTPVVQAALRAAFVCSPGYRM